MARGRALALAALALMFAPAGCGFEPLYGARDPAGGGGRLAVAVAPIPERDGQALRAALRRSFDPLATPDYALEVALSEEIVVAAVDDRGDAVRKRMTLAAHWKLAPLDARLKVAPIEGDARAFEAFNVLASEYANVTAERAARLRAAERLANAIAVAATARVRARAER